LVSSPSLTRLQTTARYCTETEVHVYALAVAACVLLSFYPFLIVIVSFCKYLLHWPDAVNAIFYAVNDYMPGEMGQFVNRNLDVSVRSQGKLQFVSMFLLLFTANGIFEPMEVALNRVWGAAKNRSYIKNQVLSLALILTCGGLVLSSFLLTALNQDFLKSSLHMHAVPTWLAWTIFKVAAVPISILALFLIYWVLPNCKIPARRVILPAVVVGLSFELLKYFNILMWPTLKTKLNREYGPFYISVAIVLLSFVSTMMVLAAAHWAARKTEWLALNNGKTDPTELTLENDEKLGIYRIR
jgi:membrane protein